MPNQHSRAEIPVPFLSRANNTMPQAVCASCGARLEIVVNFKGKIVWTIDPDNPDFGSQQPTLRGETGNISVKCSADVLHNCGYTCINGELVEAKK